jgi:hypothetical protein
MNVQKKIGFYCTRTSLITTSVVDPNSFFSDSDPQIFLFGFWFWSVYLYFDPNFFFKWWLALLSFVFWNLYDREKSFPTEKLTFFCLSSVWSAIFHNFFYFTTVSGSESKSELFSDSDPAKIFGFFRIRIHNTDHNKLLCSFRYRCHDFVKIFCYAVKIGSGSRKHF